MKERVITMKDFEREAKKREIKNWFNDKINKAGKWVNDNKELIIVLGPVVIGGATKLIMSASKHVQQSKEEELKNLYCYDRSLGHYWKLRRELTNSEWVEIDKRKANGERLADILDDLKVLK